MLVSMRPKGDRYVSATWDQRSGVEISSRFSASETMEPCARASDASRKTLVRTKQAIMPARVRRRARPSARLAALRSIRGSVGVRIR